MEPTSSAPIVRPASLIACLFGSLLLRAAAGGLGILVGLLLAKIHLDGLAAGGQGVPIWAVGMATALFYVSELIGAPGLGVLSDRHGRRPFLLISPVLGGAAAAVMLALPLLPIILLSKLFAGLSTAASAPASLGYFADATSGHPAIRGRVMAAFEIATVLGMISGFYAAGQLWDRLGTTSFGLLIAVYALSWLAFFLVKDVRTRQHAAHSSLLSALRLPGVIAFIPAWLAVNAILGAWFSHIGFQLARDDDPTQLLVGGYSGAHIGQFAAITGVIFLAGLAFWGSSLGRLGALRSMRFGLVGMLGLCPAVFLLNHSAPGDVVRINILLVLAGLSLLVASGFTPAALAHLADISESGPDKRGAVMGLYSVLFGLGQLLGSLLSAPLIQAFAVDGLVLFSLLMVGASAIGVAVLSLRSFPRPPSRVPAALEAEAGS